MNKHYRTENDSFEPEKVFRPEQEGKPLEVTEKLETLGENQLNQEHFEDLEKRRGLSEETVKQYIRPVNKQILEELEESFDSDTLVKSGWFKYECQICSQETGPTFNRFEEFEEHVQEEHNREDAEKYRDWLYTLIPEKGYLIKYIDTESGKTVYGNIRDRDPEPELSKYCQPHQSHVEARKSYRQGIFPAFDEVGGETLVITEGEFKSLALKEQGWNSVAIAGVSLSQDNLDRLFQISSQYDKVVYVVDDDMGGLLSIPSMTSEMNHRGLKIQVQVSKDKDIDDKHAEGLEYELQADKPLNVLMNNLETLQSKEHLISKYGKPEDILEVFYQTVQGLKRSHQESQIKKATKQINERLDEGFNTNTVKSELNDWRKQFNRKKRHQKREEEEDQEEVSEFQETIEVNGEDIALNPVEFVNIQRHVKTVTELPKNDKRVVKPNQKFKIYEIAFGKGSDEDSFLLFTDPERELNLGEKWFPLRQADLSKEEYENWMKKKFREAQEDGFEGSFQDFRKQRYEGRVLEIADYIDRESIRKIKDMSNEAIREDIVEKYLNNGFHYDEKLTTLNHPKIVRHNKSKVDAGDVMPYNPHSAYITATKTGKSRNSGRVGVKMDKMSSSGLLGYASADDLRKGSLDGMTEPFFADEIRHGNEENIGDKLLTIFEEGASLISKGQKDMKPEFYGSFTYISNPKKTDDLDQIDYFMDFVEKLGNNSQALGSRLGILLFDLNDMDKAKPDSPLNKDEREKLKTLVDWIKDEVADQYTHIEQRLNNWLHKEYPDGYEERIDGWKARMYSQKANEFLEGHKDSYRHARGQALRMAVYQNIGYVLKEDYSIDKIKEDAEDKFQEVMEINLFSISNLTDALSDKDRVRQHKEALLESEETLYLKLFVKSVISKAKEDEEVFESIEPVQSLKSVFNEIKEDLDSIDDSSKYWNFSRIVYELEDNLGRANQRLRDRYGLKLNEDNGNLFVKISDYNKFKVYPEISSESVPSVPCVSSDSEKSTPPTYPEEGDSEDERGIGGGKKEKTQGTKSTKCTVGDKRDKSDIGKSVENDTPPPSNEGDSEENGENQGGGVGKKRENPTSQTSRTSRNQESSVIVKSQDTDEIKKGLDESEVKAILKVFQEHQPLKRSKAQNHLDEPIEDVNSKVSDLKKLGLLDYDSTTHQFSLTDEGKGKIENQNLESVF